MSIEVLGLVTGVIFGVLLQRARVCRYDTQIGVLLFRDFTIVKFMLSAVIVGSVGIYLLKDQGLVTLSVKPMIMGGVVIGGLVFGAGWALLGYCPATSMAAVGEGRWDAVGGIAGMVVGASIFAHMYPLIRKTLLTWGDFGKITLPQVFKTGHWPVLLVWAAVALVCLVLIEYSERGVK